MKKQIVILFIVGFIPLSLFSQETKWNAQNFIGFNGGISYSSIFLIYENAGQQLNITNPYINTSFGGVSFKNFSERLVGLSVDLNYIQKGGYSEFTYDIDTVELAAPVLFRYLPSYIELTPLMNVRTGKKRSHINIYAGPHISWLIKDKIEFGSEALLTGNTFKSTADTKFEFGLNIGTGYSFDFNKNSIEVKLMYSHGLTNVFDAETSNSNQWFIQNQVISASLAYYYKL